MGAGGTGSSAGRYQRPDGSMGQYGDGGQGDPARAGAGRPAAAPVAASPSAAANTAAMDTTKVAPGSDVPGLEQGTNVGPSVYRRPDGTLGTQGDGQAGDPVTPYAGTPYSGADPADLLRSDPRDFLYGRTASFASDKAQQAENDAQTQRAEFAGLANSAIDTGNTAQRVALNNGAALWNQGVVDRTHSGDNTNLELGAAGQLGGTAQQELALAGNVAGASGQSAAQAQLQSGLNQSEASNLALARSGRGFGQSGAALGQAIDANAAASQQATNSSAQLRLQSQQAAAGIYGQAAGAQQGQAGIYGGVSGQQQQSALANQQSGVNSMASGFNQQMQGDQLGGQIEQQGIGDYYAGQNAEKQWIDSQHNADIQREQLGMQQYGIESGAATSAAAQNAQQTGAILGAVGTIGGAVIGTVAGGPAGGAAGAALGSAAGQAAASEANQASDIRAKANIKPADGEMAAPTGYRPQIAPTAPGGLAAPRMAAAPAAPMGPMPARPMAPPSATQALGPAGLGSAVTQAAAGIAGGAQAAPRPQVAPSTLASLQAARARMAPVAPQPQARVPPTPVQQAAAPPGASIGAAMGGAIASDEHSKTRIQELEAQVASLSKGSKPAHSASEFYQAPNISGINGGVQIGSAIARAQAAAQARADAANAGVSTSRDNRPYAHPAGLPQYAGRNKPPTLPMGAASPEPSYAGPVYGMTPATSTDAWQDRVLGQQLREGSAQGETPEGDAPLAGVSSNAPEWLDRYMGSDKEIKSGVSGGGSDALGDAFSRLHGYSYDYRDPDRHGEGRQYGFMAQDLAQTPAGASAIKRDPTDDTMMVDTGKLAMMQAPVVGKHERRLADLQAEIDQLMKRKAS